MEIRRSYDRLISTMGFPILARRHVYIESGPGPRLASCVARRQSPVSYRHTEHCYKNMGQRAMALLPIAVGNRIYDELLLSYI